MSSNRITLIQGTSQTFAIMLVDEDGEVIPPADLEGASARFELKTSPSDASWLIDISTADPTHVKLDTRTSTVTVNLLPPDTSGIAVGTYAYQLGVTLADGYYFVAIPWEPFDVILGGIAAPPLPPFTNTVKVDQNWSLPGSLRYVTPGGSPIAGAQIRLYYKSDYDAGVLNAPVGITQTTANGDWRDPVLVFPGYSYVIQFFLPNEFGPDVTTIVV
jgi:hypothetical protein